MKTRLNTLFVAIAIALAMPALCGNVMAAELNKTYSKEFTTDSKTHLFISNRYGHVEIVNWEKDAIAIDVEVIVEHRSQEKAERMLESISITLEQAGNEVRGITDIDEKLMMSLNNFSIGSPSKEMQINYKIRMPKSVNSELHNKYGDIFIDELTGYTTIELKYGNLKANRLVYGNKGSLNTLKLGYGNASIDEVSWMSFDIKYASLSIEQGQAVVVESKYSKLNFNSLNSLVLESKYDNVNLGNIANIAAESGYTNYRIKRLAKSLSVESRYGDVKVDNVASSIQSISFDGAYASINVPIPQAISYNIDCEVSYGGVYGSSNWANVNRVESSNKVKMYGVVGKANNPKAKVMVRVKYGSVRLE